MKVRCYLRPMTLTFWILYMLFQMKKFDSNFFIRQNPNEKISQHSKADPNEKSIRADPR